MLSIVGFGKMFSLVEDEEGNIMSWRHTHAELTGKRSRAAQPVRLQGSFLKPEYHASRKI